MRSSGFNENILKFLNIFMITKLKGYIYIIDILMRYYSDIDDLFTMFSLPVTVLQCCSEGFQTSYVS